MGKGRGLRPFFMFAWHRLIFKCSGSLVAVPVAEAVAPAVPECFTVPIIRMPAVVAAVFGAHHWPTSPVLRLCRRCSHENQQAAQRHCAQYCFTEQRL